MTTAIEIQNLRKEFNVRGGFRDVLRIRNNPTVALGDVSFRVEEGEIFGLLGPNGAGKTTLIKILSTLILPTSGTARIHGHDVVSEAKETKRLVGLIHSDERSFFWRLTGRQNLEFFAALFQIPRKTARRRIDELLHEVGLEDKADMMFHYYSTGMKQKLAIVRGLLPEPKVLFMDEALRSVDPVTTLAIRRFIRERTFGPSRGTVIIATNRLDEAAELCDRVAILNRGKLMACGSKDQLSAYYRRPIEYDLEISGVDEQAVARISRLECVRACVRKEQGNGTVHLAISMHSDNEDLDVVLREIIFHNGHVRRCIRVEPSLEALFLDIVTGDKDSEGAPVAR